MKYDIAYSYLGKLGPISIAKNAGLSCDMLNSIKKNFILVSDSYFNFKHSFGELEIVNWNI